MNEDQDVTAGLNSTLSLVSSAVQWLISSLSAVLLDEDGEISSQLFFRVKDQLVRGVEETSLWLHPSPAQAKLGTLLIFVLAVNFILIALAWHYYGQKIS